MLYIKEMEVVVGEKGGLVNYLKALNGMPP